MINNPEITVNKSGRHSKIAGDFFESLVLYLLSKNGFECALVDHTGIDIIAKNPSGEYMGISVKGRTRNDGQKAGRVKIDNYDDHKDKIIKACQDFGDAVPYLAVVVDAEGEFSGTLASLENIEDISKKIDKNLNWSMTQKSIDGYRENDNVAVFNFSQGISTWWGKSDGAAV